MAADAYNSVIVSSLTDSGESKRKFDESVNVKTCYDPNGISVIVQSGKLITSHSQYRSPVSAKI